MKVSPELPQGDLEVAESALQGTRASTPLGPSEPTQKSVDARGSVQSIESQRSSTWTSHCDLPDEHLMLGMTVEAVHHVAELTGFSKGFSREAFFANKLGRSSTKPQEDWITPAYGPALTGYDFGNCIRQWHKATGNEEISSAEYLQQEDYQQEEDTPGVGDPRIFLSHVQSEPLEATLKVTESYLWAEARLKHGVVYFWLDYVILRQCMNDFEPSHIVSVIQRIGWTVALEDERETYFDRLFCVFELASSTMFAGDETRDVRLDVCPSEKTLEADDYWLRICLRVILTLLFIGGPAAFVLYVPQLFIWNSCSVAVLLTLRSTPSFFLAASQLAWVYMGNPDWIVKEADMLQNHLHMGPVVRFFKSLRRRCSTWRRLNTKENAKCRSPEAEEKIRAFIERKQSFAALDETIIKCARLAALRRRRHTHLNAAGIYLMDVVVHRLRLLSLFLCVASWLVAGFDRWFYYLVLPFEAYGLRPTDVLPRDDFPCPPHCEQDEYACHQTACPHTWFFWLGCPATSSS
eukprot:TRINITY_DN29660_c0_g1_i1.p1 TRINITY_DN29660_c0_g1~~TRINITY_DN29660_c0_g1_i1.p1  ORF type:complete len:521 (+),score=54.84 TRINITY_DN29660_c0_g1_i1:105-1667(+)